MQKSENNETSIKQKLTESVNQLKSLDLLELSISDRYLDVMDLNPRVSWKVAKILEKSPTHIKIRFDGWSSTWDEKIQINSKRFAPFRQNTINYTGSPNARENEFPDLFGSIKICLEKMDYYSNNKFLNEDVYKITQFLRGELYILVDFIMASSRISLDIMIILNFLTRVITFFVDYLDILPLYLPEYIEGKQINPLLYLVNGKIAVCNSFFEMIDIFKKILGSAERTWNFFLYIENELNYDSNFLKKTKSKGNNKMLYYLDCFLVNDGFKKLMNLIQWKNEEITNNKEINIFFTPVIFLKEILYCIKFIIPHLLPNLKEKFLKEFKTIFYERIQTFSVRDTKDIDIKELLNLLRGFQISFSDNLTKETLLENEDIQINIIFKFLKSSVLEKQLKAIDEIKYFINLTDTNFSNDNDIDSNIYSKNMTLTPEKLKKILLQKNFLEYILGENFHIELLKRTKPIFVFLTNLGAINKNYVDILWKLSQDSHDTNKTAVYEVIIEISKYLDKDLMDYIFFKLNEIPQEKYDDITIELYKEFTINSSKGNDSSGSASFFSSMKKFFQNTFSLSHQDIYKLWILIQDDSKLDPIFIKSAINAITEILKKVGAKNDKEKYLVMAIENLQKGLSVIQSLLIFMLICNSFRTDSWSFNMMKDAVEEIVAKLNKKYGLIEITIKDLDRYMSLANKIYELKKKKKQPIENYNKYIFEGKYTYKENLENRLNFIGFISFNSNKKYDLTLENLKSLWSIFFKKSNQDMDQNLFLNWLIKEKSEKDNKIKNFYLSEELLMDFYKILLNDFDALLKNKISLELMKFLQILFEFINNTKKNLEINSKNFIRVANYNNLVGLDCFWKILYLSENEMVLSICRQILLNIHLRFNNDTYKGEKKLEVWKIFVDKCIKMMNEKDIKLLNLNYYAKTLRLFIYNLEGYAYLQSESPLNSYCLISVKLSGSDEKAKIKLPSNSLIYHLRKRILEEFNLKSSDFEMYISKNTNPITPEQEEDYSVSAIENVRDRDYKESDIDINVNIKKNSVSRFSLIDNLKLYLSNNKSITEILFNLLNNSKMANDDTIWDLIKLFPPNQDLKKEILSLNVDGSEENWRKYFFVLCKKKFFYILEIVSDVIKKDLNADKMIDEYSWTEKFSKKNGFKFLTNIFSEFLIIENKFDLNLCEIMVKFIVLSLKIDNFQGQIKKIFAESFNLMHKVFSFLKDKEIKLSSDFIDGIFELFSIAFMIDNSLIKQFNDRVLMKNLLTNVFFECKDNEIKNLFEQNFIKIQKITDSKSQKPLIVYSPLEMFNLLIKEILLVENLLSYRDKCECFFNFLIYLGYLLDQSEIDSLKQNSELLLEKLYEYLIKQLKSLPIYEKSQNDRDFLLQGLIKLLQLLIRFDNNYKISLLNDEEFIKILGNEFLFEFPTNLTLQNDIPPPKCKSNDSRRTIFLFLIDLINIDNSNLLILTKIINDLLLSSPWRSNSQNDWIITSSEAEKSRTGYVGLKNLGTTCYMNSLFQQFFMISDFRESLLKVPIRDSEKEEEINETILYNFQLIMQALKSSQKGYYEARSFCNVFKNNEGLPINLMEQMDVDEFLANFLEKIEIEIKGTPYENLIKNTFGGMLSDELIGKECPHYSEKEEAFLSLSLQVKNKKNIENSLAHFIQGDLLEGPNAYFCEKCNKKVKTLKRQCIKRLPNMLILVLKRFEFNYETMLKIKLNDFCEFPQELNMHPFTQNYLKKTEKQIGSKEKIEEFDDLPQDYYQYKLNGVVIHMGTADCGHYISIIKEKNNDKKENKWFEFNDITIREFNINDLAQEAFGGEDKNMSEYNKNIREKSNNAYLLFYERNKFFDENGKEINKFGENDLFFTEKTENSLEIYQDIIKDDNFKYFINKNLVDSELEIFFYEILNNHSLKNSDKLLEYLKLSFKYFVIVRIRLANRDKLPRFVKIIKNIIENNMEFSIWCLKQFHDIELINEYLIDCPINDMKYIFYGVLKKIIEKINENDRQLDYEKFINESPIVNFLKVCLYNIFEQNKLNNELVIRLINVLCSKNENWDKLLMEYNIFNSIIEFLSNKIDISLNKQNNNEFSLIKQNSNEINRFKSELRNHNIISQQKKKKVKKNITESLQKNTIYFNEFILLLSNLLNEKNYALILNKTNILQKILEESKKKKTRIMTAKIFSKLCSYNEENSNKMIKFLMEEIEKVDESDLKVYWISLEEIMFINDEFQEIRIKVIIEKIMNYFETNYNYYKCIEMMFDYIFKLSGRNPKLLSEFSLYLKANKEKYKLLEQWIIENKDLFYKFDSKKTFKFSKNKNTSVNTYSFSLNSDKHKRNMDRRMRKIERLFKGNTEELQPSIDTDEEFSDKNFKIGDKIDYIFEKFVYSCEIIESMDEMYKIKSENSNFQRWIFNDDEKIGPYKKLKDYNEDLFEYSK